MNVRLHELEHAVIARRYQISVRSITLFIFGGVAQIGAEPPSARAEFWIALAGPAVTSIVRRCLRPAWLRAIRREWTPPCSGVAVPLEPFESCGSDASIWNGEVQNE